MQKKARYSTTSVARVPAAEIENAVIDQFRGMLRAPEIVVGTWRLARQEIEGLTEALERRDPLWDELFPAEQARIVQLLVERVDVGMEGVEIRLRSNGLVDLVHDLNAVAESRSAA